MLKATLVACVAGLISSFIYAQQPTPAAPFRGQAGAQASPASGSTMAPVPRADSAPQGTLKNPYNDRTRPLSMRAATVHALRLQRLPRRHRRRGHVSAADQRLWVYGGDDDTLFRLIGVRQPDPAEQGLQPQGLRRTSSAPCPRWGNSCRRTMICGASLRLYGPTTMARRSVSSAARVTRPSACGLVEGELSYDACTTRAPHPCGPHRQSGPQAWGGAPDTRGGQDLLEPLPQYLRTRST